MQSLFPETEPRETGADFSPCGRYRYRLWRIWDRSKPLCVFLMLNPSKADAQHNDPTVERCERRAREWGYGGLVVINLFAFRATDPAVMLTYPEPIGPENDAAIRTAAQEAGLLVLAWGNEGAHRDRSAEVRKLLFAAGVKAHSLKVNGSGEPAHPLYLSYALRPQPFDLGAKA